jgi:hypothetical protein
LESAVRERRPDEQPDDDGRADPEVADPAAQSRAAGAGCQKERDVTEPDHAVRDREGEGAVAERLRDKERDDEKAGRRRQHHEANGAFLGLDDAGEPDVTHPRPPDRREREHPSSDPRPTRLRRDQRRALREAEHEHEVEEQLERLDRLSFPKFGAEPRCADPGDRSRRHE